MSLSSSNIRILESCINRALFRIFGSCDKSSLDYIKTITGLHNIKAIVDKRHCSFINKLIADVSYSNLLLVCLLYTSPSPRDRQKSRMPSSA